MFQHGATITVNLPQGHKFPDAVLMAWEEKGITFMYSGTIHFMPWNTVWSVTQPQPTKRSWPKEATAHVPTAE